MLSNIKSFVKISFCYYVKIGRCLGKLPGTLVTNKSRRGYEPYQSKMVMKYVCIPYSHHDLRNRPEPACEDFLFRTDRFLLIRSQYIVVMHCTNLFSIRLVSYFLDKLLRYASVITEMASVQMDNDEIVIRRRNVFSSDRIVSS